MRFDMIWETPKFAELKMDAEIGSYQDDFQGDREPSFVKDEELAE